MHDIRINSNDRIWNERGTYGFEGAHKFVSVDLSSIEVFVDFENCLGGCRLARSARVRG